ncbi:MAG TPA: translocation/assembly module TamB domain-containing protein [Myxococcota bacterium]|nr:translocation/assembly module TamB domain-containing protein [Myxococcota bacterium]HQK50573.1 translocation/assembly module TamB domain-containing protein [Myxococcota bacterium]
MNRLRRLVRTLAIGTYLLVTRSLLTLLLLFPGVHFLINASPFPDHLTRLLQGVLPGRLEFGRIQVAPIPWQVDVQDVHIRAPDGEAVITAGRVRTRLDLGPLLRFLSGATPELHLHFRRVDLEDYEALVDFDDHGHLHLVDAFSRPSTESKPPTSGKASPGTPVRLTFDRITGRRGACRVLFPEWDIRVEGVALETRLSVVTAPTTHVRVDASSVTFTHGIGHIRAAPGVPVIPRIVTLGPGDVGGFVYDWDRIAFNRASFSLPGLTVEAQDGALAWSQNLRHEGIAVLRFDPDSPLLALGTGGRVRGPLSLEVRARGDYDDPRFSLSLHSPDLMVGPLPLGSVDFQMEGGRDERGVYLFSGIEGSSAGPLGVLSLAGGTFTPFRAPGGPAGEASLSVAFDRLDPASWFRVLGRPVPLPPVPVPRSLSGRLAARWEVQDWSHLDGLLSLSGEAQASLPPGSLLGSDQASLSLEVHSRGALDRPSLEVREARLQAGPDRISVQGGLSLPDGVLDLRGSATKDLKPLFRLAGLSGAGTLVLSGLRVTGTLDFPLIGASTRVEHLAWDDWVVNWAEAALSWDGSRLRAMEPRASLPAGEVRASEVLLHPGGDGLPTRLVVREGIASSLEPSRLPLVRGVDVRGRTSVEVPRLTLSWAPAGVVLEGDTRIAATSWVLWKRPFRDVEMQWTFSRQQWTLEHLEARSPETGTIRAQGTLALPGRQIQASLNARDLPLDWLLGLGRDTTSGAGDLEVRATGSWTDPELGARAAFRDLRILRQAYPDIELIARRAPSGDLQVEAPRFLPRVRVLPGTGLTWREGRFEEGVLSLSLDGVSPQDLWPPIPPERVSGTVQGNLLLRYGLGAGGSLAGEWTSPARGIDLRWLGGEVDLTNRDPWRLRLTPGGSVVLDPVTLQDGSWALQVCGVVLGSNGDVDLRAAGDLPVHWVRLFLGDVATAEGALGIGASPGGLATPAPEGCGTGAIPRPFRVLGSWSRPQVGGTVTLGDLEIGIRGLGESIRLPAGGRVVLSPRQRRLLVEIPPEAPIRGFRGTGRASLFGEALLDGLVPEQGRLLLEGSGIEVSRPGEYRLVLDPSLEARFETAESGDVRMRIQGRIQVPEGSYHRNFDIISRAFSQMTGARQVQREGRSLEETVPWLAEAELDLAVTGGPLEVRTRLPVGATDLEVSPDLRLRGRLADPEVWNRVVVLPGGKLIYNVVRREFEVVRGTLDFDGPATRPRVDLLARTLIDVPGSGGDTPSFSSRFGPDATRTTGLDEGLLVTIQVSGRFPDMDISLASNSRGLSQSDLQSLILTGTLPQGGQATSGGNQVISLGLLTQDVTGLAAKVLLGSLLDTINLGVSPEGGVNLDLMAHLGSRLRFETQVLQGSTSSRYQAGFQVSLSDWFSLIGRVRAIERDPDPSRIGNRYETKLRLRIPLE